MTTTSQVEQAVNYRVGLKAAKAENQRRKTENGREQPASSLQQPKTSDREGSPGGAGVAERRGAKRRGESGPAAPESPG